MRYVSDAGTELTMSVDSQQSFKVHSDDGVDSRIDQ